MAASKEQAHPMPRRRKGTFRSGRTTSLSPACRLLIPLADLTDDSRSVNLSPQELDHKAAQIVDVDRLVQDSHGPRTLGATV
jgi:hypothetical protein